MQAILVADYSFVPIEHWRSISQNARQFINRCLTIDPKARITAHEALQHPWITNDLSSKQGEDLLPTVKKNFNARRTLHKAIDTVRAINKLREGGGLMMDGAASIEPRPEHVVGNEVHDDDQMKIDSRGNARGQTDEQIREQERKVKEVVTGLWKSAANRN
jgi:calcium/calmodulin-dependent protein kinase I